MAIKTTPFFFAACKLTRHSYERWSPRQEHRPQTGSAADDRGGVPCMCLRVWKREKRRMSCKLLNCNISLSLALALSLSLSLSLSLPLSLTLYLSLSLSLFLSFFLSMRTIVHTGTALGLLERALDLAGLVQHQQRVGPCRAFAAEKHRAHFQQM